MRSGGVTVGDVPPPTIQRGQLLVRTAASLISAGTERNTVELGKRSLLGKAKQRPDLVKQVIQKARTEGLMSTYTAVKAKLDGKTALGYSSAGIVIGVGEGVSGFRVGNRVACAGAGYASHAEVNSVPQNLCVSIPDQVSFDEAAFGTLGAIAMQGVRLAQPSLGEAVVVIGLGLLGQITVQLLKANGCRVFGVDLDSEKLKLARELGAERCSAPSEAAHAIDEWSRGRGADAVLITAATMSNDPIELAGEVSRMKGRVVVVGLVGMDVPRNVYYLKELSLQVSMSYGPGRYDAEYEERGHDYPFAYVRWTEGRNIEAFLDLIAAKSVDVGRLITHRFSIDHGEDAYKLISGETSEPYLGIVLQYDTATEIASTISLKPSVAAGPVRIGMIGAGSYAKKFLLPNFRSENAAFASIVTATGVTANDVAKQYGFSAIRSEPKDVISDESANLIVIATRHDLHARCAAEALANDKHVFVEKPLALNDAELDSVLSAAEKSSGRLMVGFNRRFSPSASMAAEFFAGRQSPLSIVYRVNAGRIPHQSWIQDPIQGGGRIIGEVCHFIDMMHFLTGSVTTRVFAESVTTRNAAFTDEDSVLITLKFADGSNGTIAYLAEGDKSVPKERVEIFGGGSTFIIDDFRRTFAYRNGRETSRRFMGQDKGQAAEVKAVCEWVKAGGDAPISLEDLTATTRATFRVLDSLRSGSPEAV